MRDCPYSLILWIYMPETATLDGSWDHHQPGGPNVDCAINQS